MNNSVHKLNEYLWVKLFILFNISFLKNKKRAKNLVNSLKVSTFAADFLKSSG